MLDQILSRSTLPTGQDMACGIGFCRGSALELETSADPSPGSGHAAVGTGLMRRNVGIITTWLERGAAYVSRQYRRALEAQHEVFIYARGGERRPVSGTLTNDARVTWAKAGIIPTATSIDLDDFEAWIRHNRIDVVMFNEQHWWEPVLFCDRLGITTGAYVVEYTEPTIPFYACYDFLVCNTRQHFETFRWHPRALYLPWGTDLGQFAPARWAPIRPGCTTFFHSGGMNPRRKGSDLVVNAFSRVCGPAHLVLHTQVRLDEALPGMSSRIRELSESGRLTLIERTVPDRAALFHLGDVCVYPSRFDGLGLTVAEALASALPVITSHYPPMNEFINSSNGKLVHVTGFSPQPDRSIWPECVIDEADLTRKMQDCVDDPAGIEDLRRAARRYAEEHLDWSRNAQTLPDFIGSAQRRSTKDKSAAIEHVRAFERRRATESVRFWLSYYVPRLVKAARTVWRAGHRAARLSGNPVE